MDARDELTALNHWVAWRYEIRPGSDKPTKPPVNPISGGPASHSNPSHWSTFEVAMRRAERDNLAGVGLVITPDDGYTAIDLDKCRDPDTGELAPWAAEIVALAETYTEVSPSLTGLRMIVRGKAGKSVKYDPAGVEIYVDKRYVTVTWDHVPGTPTDIRPAPKTLEALAQRVERFRAENAKDVTPIATTALPARVNRAGAPSDSFFRKVNDLALRECDVWVKSVFPTAKLQPGTGAYRVTSKDLGRNLQEDLSIDPNGIVDFGVADIGDANQGKRTAIDLLLEYNVATSALEAARWFCHRLGVTPESLGFGEEDRIHLENGNRIVEAIEANLPDLVQTADGVIVDAKTGEISQEHAAEPRASLVGDEFPEHLTHPPGFLGGLVEYINRSAAGPRRAFSLMSAVSMLGTVLGRHWAGPTFSSTTLYIVLLAPSGSGKDHYVASLAKILNEAGLPELIGENNFMSQGAIYGLLMQRPCCLSMMDEIAETIAKMSGKRAASHETGMAQTLKELWGKNFSYGKTPGYAARRGESFHSPALSILGLSTHEKFWGSFESGAKADGFLNRFMLLTFNDRPKIVQPEITLENSTTPGWIIDGLFTRLAGGCDEQKMKAISTVFRAEAVITPRQVPWMNDEAKQVYHSHRESIIKRFGNDEDKLTFFARTSENAVRLATIRAVGANAEDPAVSEDDMRWGIQIAEWATRQMMIGAGEWMSENDFHRHAQKVIRIIRSTGGKASQAEIAKRLNNKLKSRDLTEVLNTMVDSCTLVELDQVKTRGRKSRWFRLSEDLD